MTPNSHLHNALAREREADIVRRIPRRPFPAELAAGVSVVIGVAGLVALGAPLGA